MLVKTELKGENPQVTKMQYEAHVMPPPTPPESYCASDEKLLDDQQQQRQQQHHLACLQQRYDNNYSVSVDYQ